MYQPAPEEAAAPVAEPAATDTTKAADAEKPTAMLIKK
jgi:hypothetical protein